MAFIEKWIFIPQPSKEKKSREKEPSTSRIIVEEIVEEIQPKRESSLKDKLIVYFVFFLMGISIISLLAYLGMVLFKVQDADKALNIFYFTLSPLFGYLLGTNKERQA